MKEYTTVTAHCAVRHIGNTQLFVLPDCSLMTEPVKLVNTNETFDRTSVQTWYRRSVKGEQNEWMHLPSTCSYLAHISTYVTVLRRFEAHPYVSTYYSCFCRCWAQVSSYRPTFERLDRISSRWRASQADCGMGRQAQMQLGPHLQDQGLTGTWSSAGCTLLPFSLQRVQSWCAT